MACCIQYYKNIELTIILTTTLTTTLTTRTTTSDENIAITDMIQ